MSASARVVEALREQGRTVAVAESLTGGLLAAALVEVPGASAVLLGGVVSYASELKARLLGVDPQLLSARGAVNEDVARQMARGVRRACAVAGKEADLGVATTGVAGPEPADGADVGTVFIAVQGDAVDRVDGLHIRGDRRAVREQTVAHALRMLEDVAHTGAEYRL